MMTDSKCLRTSQEIPDPQTFLCRKRTHILRVIGQFVAKAMLDSRIIDLSVNKIFLKLVLSEDVALTLDNLRVSTISLYLWTSPINRLPI